MTTQPLINLQGIRKVFRTEELETSALDDINLAIEQGEYVSISGPSGCGKSTLLSVLGLLHSATHGKYFLNGKEVTSLPAAEQARVRSKEIGFIFQAFNLIPDMSASENVELPLTYRDDVNKSQRHEMVMAALEQVNMSDRHKHYPAQLSGGQQQRAAIARALAMQPKAMLFDEPTSALDPEMVGEVLEVMTALARDGMTMVVVTHEMGFARHAANRVVFMADGQLIEDAPPAEFFDNPRSERARDFLSKVLTH
jgi:glutamate transport system ATP-binding protein